ncbi:SMI1/KNR4 family protein [Niallia alba]|uniref:SMI1/KNR4 family protein n=1 Tax=Niallia alba TaxID=2729105 RepID=UPI002E24C62B|nr:SMI1/KNR4 family protein [Niallia alba]
MKKIWNLEDNNYILETLNQKDIEFAEKYFACKLPEEYLNQLKIRNGGYLLYDALPVKFKNSWADDHIPIPFLLGLKKGKGIFKTKELLKEWGINEDKFIIISGDGHYWIVLDYRTSDQEPKVTFIDTEFELVEVIFNSFKEMVASLYTHEYEDKDFEQYEYEVSLENAKGLIHSNNTDDILHGISLWVGTLEEMESLIKILFRFIHTHENSDVIYSSFETLTNLVVNDFISDKNLAKSAAQKLLEEIEQQNDSVLDPFKFLLSQYLNG